MKGFLGTLLVRRLVVVGGVGEASSSGRLGTLAGRDWSKKQAGNHPPYRSTQSLIVIVIVIIVNMIEVIDTCWTPKSMECIKEGSDPGKKSWWQSW